MKKTIRNALLLLGGICLAASVGLTVLLTPRFRSGVLPGTETTVSICGEGEEFSLVILADDSVPRNRLDPLARMVQKSGGTSYLLRQTDDLEPLRRFSEKSDSATLLFTYGEGWENALTLLEGSDRIASTVILSPAGEFDPSGLSVQSPVMLLGTSRNNMLNTIMFR